MRNHYPRFPDEESRFPEDELKAMGFHKVERPENMAPRDSSENTRYERSLSEMLSDAYDETKGIIHNIGVGIAKGIILLLHKYQGSQNYKIYVSRSTDIPNHLRLQPHNLN